MRPRLPLALSIAAIAALVGLAPSSAHAYERQWHFGGGLGYAYAGDGLASGFGASAHLTYGLTDAFNLLAEVDATYHPSPDALFMNASVGAAYVIDVLQWVPYVGLMAGGYETVVTGSCDAGCASTRFGLSVPVGLDYQLSRSAAVGVGARYHLIVTGEPGVTSAVTAFARVEYLWGY